MVSGGWRRFLFIEGIVTLLRIEGWHRDAEAQGIKVMSFVVFFAARTPRSSWRREAMVEK